ncbi:hypothetical protein Fmac_010636 [Flemingia macrophylla]|uniref:Uncharacterized protein n=1 Tax=Flemingia macrophylla TaxID=520843 RepID=A0ABD1MK66_9FABA
MAGLPEERNSQPYGVSVPPKRKRERVSEASMKRRKLMLDLNEPAFPDLNKAPPPDTSSDEDENEQLRDAAYSFKSLSRLASLLVRSRGVTARDVHRVFLETGKNRVRSSGGGGAVEEESGVLLWLGLRATLSTTSSEGAGKLVLDLVRRRETHAWRRRRRQRCRRFPARRLLGIAGAPGNIEERESDSNKKGYWKRFREWILSMIKKDAVLH